MNSAKCIASLVICAFCFLYGCEDSSDEKSSKKEAFKRLNNQPIMLDAVDRDYDLTEPLRALPGASDLVYSKDLVHLGNRLFNDIRLSGDETISCASCHDVANGGVDGLQLSVGINDGIGKFNTPTVLNSSFNFTQFWNGRAATLQEQAAFPVMHPLEMGSTWTEVVRKLTEAGDYDQAFLDAFGDPTITKKRITQAIAEFESVLITPSPFDRYLRGDKNAITADAAQGYQLFKQHGCSSCHQGVNVGGNLFQKFGAVRSYYSVKSDADKGRIIITDKNSDMSVFKVPSLRNVALTAPYFHNGAAAELEMAIRVMGLAQLGRSLSDEDIRLIAEFLRSLTGEVNLLTELAVGSMESD